MSESNKTDRDSGSPEGWTQDRAQAIYALPLPDLVYQAQVVHRESFPSATVETARLLNIKTGGCPEDCAYCSQSAHYETGVRSTPLMSPHEVLSAARRAKADGANRFCMAAAWRSPKDRDLERVCDLVEQVKAMGLTTCATLGMLTPGQAARLRAAGLDYYNHNIDTSPSYYGSIITTRTIEDRLDTLEAARAAGLRLCCGGIIGLGETVADRIAMLVLLAGLNPPPESVPINLWSEVSGVPVAETADRPDAIALARLIALARIMMPRSVVRLSAGRHRLSEEAQALCFIAGANSIFIGEKLLTTPNPDTAADQSLLNKLGMSAASASL